MKAIHEWKQELGQGWRSLAEGWSHLREKASSALTRFNPVGERHRSGPDLTHFPEAGPNWGLLAGEVFEDAERIVVRIEAPGMEAGDFNVRVAGKWLLVSGDKRSQRHSESGHYSVVECAYGQFERAFPLPAPVLADRVQATYRHGVLRVELPKAQRSEPARVEVKVH